MKNLPGTNFQYRSAYIDVDAILSARVTMEAVALFCASCVWMVQKELFIILFCGDNESLCAERARLADIFYSQCNRVAASAGNLNLDIRIIFSALDAPRTDAVEFVPSIRQRFVDTTAPGKVIVKFPLAMPLVAFPPLPAITETYERVLFAGTFDHLHSGHKSVITQALFRTTSTLYVAVASQELLARKKCRSALEPFDLRLKRVHDFLRDIVPDYKKSVEIVMLETPDSIGPAGYLSFDAIMVTPETVSGGEAVNAFRTANGKPPVKVVVVDILDHSSVSDKLSSTSVRMSLCAGLPRGEADLDSLHSQFMDGICRRVFRGNTAAVSTLGEEWWSLLRDMYGLEPWRHFHSLRHIADLLDGAAKHYGAAGEEVPLEVELAVWFHDCVYAPRSSSNEEDSVVVLRQFAKRSGMGDEMLTDVSEAILHTKTHIESAKISRGWVSVFLELDLSILGASADRYREYSQEIKKEYLHLSPEAFQDGRRKFLESLVDFRFTVLSNMNELNDNFVNNISWELEQLT